MLNREDLCPWIIDALQANGSRATVVEIAKYIWQNHEAELRASGDLFYTWQYEMRWAGQKLQDEGKIVKHKRFWALK